MFSLSILAVILPAILRLAAADPTCPTELSGEPGNGAHQDDKSLCVGQGEGSYTFALWSTAGQDTVLSIMDNSCEILATYDVPPNCNAPFSINESFLTYGLNIKSVEAQGTYGFDFLYTNGEYKIGQNRCKCSAANTVSISVQPKGHQRPGSRGGRSNQPATGCKCSFPVNGEPKS